MNPWDSELFRTQLKLQKAFFFMETTYYRKICLSKPYLWLSPYRILLGAECSNLTPELKQSKNFKKQKNQHSTPCKLKATRK